MNWALIELRREYGIIRNRSRQGAGPGAAFLASRGRPVTEPTARALSGPQLRELFAAAATWLERHVEEVNAVNVFPVPDGDTGTNMYLTLRSVMEEAHRCREEGAGAMLAAMSRGALMGARGNSGVILSQIIRGMAQAIDDASEVDAEALARGLEESAQAAYKAVTKPVEGTILTVMRDVARVCAHRVREGGVDLVSLLSSAVDAARESVERTPTLLPVLAEAGVVDAGGLGLSMLLEGMARHLRGEPLEAAAAVRGTIAQDWLALTEQRHQSEESLYGYCTEMLVEGQGLDVESFRRRMLELGDSVLVVGDDRIVRVHVHTDDPGSAVSHATAAGSLTQVKVDNIRRQAERFVHMHEELLSTVRPEGAAEALPGAISCVAVVAGDGMARVFQSVGCTRIVPGGPTMNPSTREILEAIEGCPSEDVVVLPNDKNIVMAAEQARKLSKKRVRVVPTRSMPQGIAALLAMSPEDGLDANAEAMEAGRNAVRTIEVTRAVRSTSVGGVKVKEGETIAVVDDELKLAAFTPEEATAQALDSVVGPGTSLITLYYGAGTQGTAAAALADDLRRRFPDHEVEVVFGGQPHYDYIVSVE